MDVLAAAFVKGEGAVLDEGLPKAAVGAALLGKSSKGGLLAQAVSKSRPVKKGMRESRELGQKSGVIGKHGGVI